MDQLIEINSLEEYEKAIQTKSIILFTASWCPDCMFIKPFIGNVVKKYPSIVLMLGFFAFICTNGYNATLGHDMLLISQTVCTNGERRYTDQMVFFCIGNYKCYGNCNGTQFCNGQCRPYTVYAYKHRQNQHCGTLENKRSCN